MPETNREHIKEQYFSLAQAEVLTDELLTDLRNVAREYFVVNSLATHFADIDPILLATPRSAEMLRALERTAPAYHSLLSETAGYREAAERMELHCLQNELLSAEFILDLHRKVYERSRYGLAGKLRATRNAHSLTGHQLPNPSSLPDILEHHISWCNDRLRFMKGISRDNFFEIFHIASELQYRLIDASPFSVGNALVARMLSNYPLLRADLWFIAIPARDRLLYHQAVRTSTVSKLTPLTDLLLLSFGKSLKLVRAQEQLRQKSPNPLSSAGNPKI